MWIKDIKNYDIEVHKDGEIVFCGNVDEAPEDIKQYETKLMTLEHKKIIIEI